MDLTPEEWRTARVRAAALLAALDACPAAAPAPAQVEPQSPEDRLLTAEEVARWLGRSVDWVYRQAKRNPAWEAFTLRLERKTLRFSEVAFNRWLARLGHTGRR